MFDKDHVTTFLFFFFRPHIVGILTLPGSDVFDDLMICEGKDAENHVMRFYMIGAVRDVKATLSVSIRFPKKLFGVFVFSYALLTKTIEIFLCIEKPFIFLLNHEQQRLRNNRGS